MDWDKLRIFYSVAQAKSLTKAGESLSLSQSAVSRQISALEDKLKTQLFHRHARGLLLTEQGEILFKTVSDMVTRLHTTETLLAESSTKPKGPFTITAPIDISAIWLSVILKEFSDLYPDIELTLLAEDSDLDLCMREADVAIRLKPSTHPDLIEKKLMPFSSAIYASNDYLHEYGTPKSLQDLKNHKIIAYSTHTAPPFPQVNWLMDTPEVRKLKITPILRTNSLNGMRRAIKAGMGIAAMPTYIMYRSRHISKILTDVQSPQTDVYYVYPMELKASTRVATFRQFLQGKLSLYNF